jgi:hypothetical protein
VYGDPCRECEYDWSIDVDDAIRLVRAAPERYEALIGDGDGSSRMASLEWSSGGYVCHVADTLRIWAERLVGAARGSTRPIAPYDADLLARARNYASAPIAGALWSLRLSVDAWEKSVALGTEQPVVLVHPDRVPSQ